MVHHAPANAVAKPFPVTPPPGDEDTLTSEVRVSEQQRCENGPLESLAAADHDRCFIARPNFEIDPTGFVGDDEEIRLGDERLRTKDALRFGTTKLRAGVTLLEQHVLTDQFRT